MEMREIFDDGFTDVEFDIVENKENINQDNIIDLEKKEEEKSAIPTPEYLLLIDWIENSPKYKHIVDIADGKTVDKKLTKKEILSQPVKSIMLSNPEEYYGKCYVTDKVKQDAVVVSRIVNYSNLLDAVTNAPLWFFAFKSMGSIPAFFLSFIISGVVLSFSNNLSTAINRKNQKALFTETFTAFSLLVILNIIQSLMSGVGTELFNNQDKLSQIKATDIVQEQLITTHSYVENIKNNPSPRYGEVKQQCESGEKELNGISRNNPRWDSLYANLYGTWQEKNKNWSGYDIAQIPICMQMNLMREEVFVEYEKAQQNYNNLLAARAETNNDLIFLAQTFPNVYQLHFNGEGRINSGIELVGLATENFLSKLWAGNFGDITLSLVIMSFSFVTSFGACLYTWFYAQDKDVKLSWDDELRIERDSWLEKQWRDYDSSLN